MSDGLQIITDESGREELLLHVAALERRLECDRVHVFEETRERSPDNPLKMRERLLSPRGRVETIRSRSDGIGCRDLTVALLESRSEEQEGILIGTMAADLLDRLLTAARNDLASPRTLIDGDEIPKGHLVDMLDVSLVRIEPEAAAQEPLLNRMRATVSLSLSQPLRGYQK